MEYQHFTGSTHYSPQDDVWFGKIEGIRDLVSYESDTPEGLEQVFREAVDEYLVDCKALKGEL